MPQVIDTSWHPLVDGVPPDWASCWGLDRFGVWAGFTVADVTQRLRWIRPGQSLMGSSHDEAERLDHEGPRHEVTFREGFWLFDTTCTEALWEAVTRTAPRRRRGANVWEWCADHWHADYNGAPADGSARIDPDKAGARRVLRGGSFYNEARDVRSADRSAGDPAVRDVGVGFRCARVQ